MTRRKTVWFVLGGLLFLAVSPSFAIALIAVAAVGAASSAFQSMNNSLVLGLSDFEYHGRIQSLMMLSFSGFGMAALPLGALADASGRVLSRAELLAVLPRGCDEHAVEMAVTRIRAALGGPEFVQTVVKRGYRLRA